MRKIVNFLDIGRKTLQVNMGSKCRIPISMHIWLTNRCPNACVYCQVHKLPQNDFWNTDALIEVLSEMKGCGTRRIHFTGGEPMLRGDIREIIERSKNMGFFTSLITSGYQVSKRADELRSADIVYVSYDGPGEIQNNLRRGISSGDVELALKALKEEAIPVWTVTVLTRLNMEYIEDIVAFARKYNVVANFSMLNFSGNAETYFRPYLNEIRELLMNSEERKGCLQKLIKMKRSGYPIGSSFAYLQNALEWAHDDRVTSPMKAKEYRCWAGRAYGYIDASGILYACSSHFLRNLGKDVTQKGFRAAWEDLPLLKDCQSCLSPSGMENNLVFSLNYRNILSRCVQLHRMGALKG